MSGKWKLRNLKVYLSDEEFKRLHIAASISEFETLGEFIADALRHRSGDVIGRWSGSQPATPSE